MDDVLKRVLEYHRKRAEMASRRLQDLVGQWLETREKILKAAKGVGLEHKDVTAVWRTIGQLPASEIAEEIDRHTKKLADIEDRIIKTLQSLGPNPYLFTALKELYRLPEDFWRYNGDIIGEIIVRNNPRYIPKETYEPIPSHVLPFVRKGVKEVLDLMLREAKKVQGDEGVERVLNKHAPIIKLLNL